MKINKLVSDNRKVIEQKGPFNVIEYQKDLSILPDQAVREYFMSEMNVRKRQVLAILQGNTGIITQAGAMQWSLGNVNATTGLKGTKDLVSKLAKVQ